MVTALLLCPVMLWMITIVDPIMHAASRFTLGDGEEHLLER